MEEDYEREEIDGQLKSELMTALQPALEHAADAAVKIVGGDMNTAMNLYSH